ncbi:MAG: flippase activity-associated protein Agl23 [Anaerolineaceae bacterium]
MMETESKSSPSWLDRPIFSNMPQIKIETILIAAIIILTIFSRFYHVDLRVMAHDEVNHVVPSYSLSTGAGYSHDPITHGPLQFHLIALSYYIFGDSDFSSRVPAVIFSIATVLFVLFGFRKYLGRTGTLVAGFLFMISPYLLYYGRYTRNEAFIGLFAVIILYATLHYLEKGDHLSLMLLTVATVLNFLAKETAYIYTAQLLLFVAIIFIDRILRKNWKSKVSQRTFILMAVGAIALLLLGLGFGAWDAKLNPTTPETATVITAAPMTPYQIATIVAIILAAVVGIVAIVIMVRSLSWAEIRKERSLDILILIATLVLPLLTAFPVKLAGKLFGTYWNPLDYSTNGMIVTGIFLAIMTGIAIAVGWWWKKGRFFTYFITFYAIFTVFQTTFFTNGSGFFTGIVGSLGYWIAQQAVNRGEQPWYFYAAIQIPMYEYLAAAGTLLALYFGIRYRKLFTLPGDNSSAPEEPTEILLPEVPNIDIEHESIHVNDPNVEIPELEIKSLEPPDRSLPTLFLLIFWSVTSLIIYSIAGEKMPWLTFHIAIPMLLAAGFGIGYLIDITPWKKLKENYTWVALLLLPVFMASLFSTLGTLTGTQPPFAGNTLDQLKVTSTFIFSVTAFFASGYGIARFLSEWKGIEKWRIFGVVIFAMLAFLTVRTSIRASYINYDNATEYLVYAHAARGPKDILEQVEEISQRTTGGKNIVVAYDNDGLYPYWWYFRDYPNKMWYTDKPTRDLLNATIILASDTNKSKVDSITKDDYVSFDYIRLWWPNQDYYNLTWDRIKYAITNPEMRSAIFDIWLNRDYTKYAAATNNQNLTLATWEPSQKLRMYIRKDVIGQIWNYGAAPVIVNEPQVDPYKDLMIPFTPDRVIGLPGSDPGQLDAPRGIAVAQDGSIYVADSRNNRIQHFASNGTFINSWGSFSDVSLGAAPGGTFYEPWGVAVGPDGSVYVTDTWNHRVQKFTADGQFLTMWGYFGQAEVPEAFWGPRGIQVDANGRVYVADTGNKRIVIFDNNGNYINQFGTAGFSIGEFDEPTGLAIGPNGEIFVADTWNQRVQSFILDENENYIPFNSWDVAGWYGQSLDNKPFMATDSAGNIYLSDPDGYRVLEFSADGSFIRGWGGYSAASDGFGLPAAPAVDSQGGIWVSDAGNNTILHFTLP